MSPFRNEIPPKNRLETTVDFAIGEPRSMKTGTTRSPFPYDAAAGDALEPVSPR